MASYSAARLHEIGKALLIGAGAPEAEARR